MPNPNLPPNTGNAKLTDALQRNLPALLETVAVPDDPEEMRWRLFFAHSQDMLGFRADIFTGGPNEADHPKDKAYKGLRDRWPDAKTMMAGLAALWLDPNGRAALEAITPPLAFKAASPGFAASLALLRGPLGNEATHVFADALDELKGHKIAYKTNAMVRAYCQNAALLAKHDYCLRTYLHSLANPVLPSGTVSDAENKWVSGIRKDFYHVGEALAPYMVCDWLLGLWLDGRISWFTLYKPDSVFLNNAHAYLPPEATKDAASFIAYCRTLRLRPEWIPPQYRPIVFQNVPPRLVNEVIWLDNNQSTPPVSPPHPPQSGKKSPLPSVASGSKLSPSDIRPSVKTVLEAAETALTGYEILERLPVALRDRLIAERGLPGAGSGSNFSAASLVTQAVDALLPSKNAPYREYKNFTGQTFIVAGKTVKPGGSAIAVYRIKDATPDAAEPHIKQADQAAITGAVSADVPSVLIVTHSDGEDGGLLTTDPADFSETTLTPPGEIEDLNDPFVLVVSTVDTNVTTEAAGGSVHQIAPLTAKTAEGERLWVAFASRNAMRLALGEGPNQRQNIRLSHLVSLFLSLRQADTGDTAGIVLNPSGPTMHRMRSDDMAECLQNGMTREQAQTLFPGTRLPLRAADIGEISRAMPVRFPVHLADEPAADGSPIRLPVPVTLHNSSYLVAFTSYESWRHSRGKLPFEMPEDGLHRLCEFFLSVQEMWQVSGVILDPFGPNETILPMEALQALGGSMVQTHSKAHDFLKLDSPLTMVSEAALAVIVRVLDQASIENAGTVAATMTDLTETLFVFLAPFEEKTLGPLWHTVHNLMSQAAGRPIDVAFAPWDERAEALVTPYGIKLISVVPPAKKKRKIGFLR